MNRRQTILLFSAVCAGTLLSAALVMCYQLRANQREFSIRLEKLNLEMRETMDESEGILGQLIPLINRMDNVRDELSEIRVRLQTLEVIAKSASIEQPAVEPASNDGSEAGIEGQIWRPSPPYFRYEDLTEGERAKIAMAPVSLILWNGDGSLTGVGVRYEDATATLKPDHIDIAMDLLSVVSETQGTIDAFVDQAVAEGRYDFFETVEDATARVVASGTIGPVHRSVSVEINGGFAVVDLGDLIDSQRFDDLMRARTDLIARFGARDVVTGVFQ